MAGIDRRQFLKASCGLAVSASCVNTAMGMELNLGGANYHQIRTFQARKKSHYTCTLCPYYDSGFTYSQDGEILKTEGNQDHIATRGKFCAKGLASFLGAYDPDRILMPMKRVGPRGSGKWMEITWQEAVTEVAGRLQGALSMPDTIVANEGGFRDEVMMRLLDTLGSRSLLRSCTPGLGSIAKQAALRQTLGVSFLLPDLEHSRYVLNFGANIMETAMPLAQRLTDGLVNNRLKLVTFDVRMSNTAGKSHEWIPVFPGTDGVVALAMANHILQKGLEDKVFLATWTNTTSDQLREELQAYTPEMAEKISGVPAATLKRIAMEFAKNKPATVFSMNGVSWHQAGGQGELACLLLAVITGNIENEGGCCLPRQIAVAAPKPAPLPLNTDNLRLNHAFPFEVLAGQRQVKVLFNHRSNPVYSAPAASVWREVLKNEQLIPFLVDFTPFMSETAELADLILPDVVGVERHDVVSSPSALFPWVSISLPTVAPQGQAKDAREVAKSIIEAVDADGQKGMKAFWAFTDAKQWVEQTVVATPGMEKEYKKLVKNGFWPEYGKIDPANRQIVNNGEPVQPNYAMPGSFATPAGKIQVTVPALRQNPRHQEMKPGEFVLVTFKVAYQALSATANIKYLSEISHANPLWINKESARKLKIRDGSLVRVTTAAGYMVTRAWVTNGIHPNVVGIATSAGHTAYGRVAQANPEKAASHAKSQLKDLDIDENIWWRDRGANPNDIIPIAIDKQSGEQAWNDTVVTLSPAEAGDAYGTIQADNAKHVAIYKQLLA